MGVHSGPERRIHDPRRIVDKPLQASYAEQTYLATLAVNEKMRFGNRVRKLRQAQKLTLRGLAARIGVGFTYLSKVENEKLDFADYPSDELIVKLAKALDADADELLLMAKKIPAKIKKRVLERPDAFRKLAGLNDKALDRLLMHLHD